MKIISVVGARPNFIKIAPFLKAIKKHNTLSNSKIEHILIHTGQHYDDRMSKSFFNSLNIPTPDINLNIGSGSHSEQVGNTMIKFEKVLIKNNPDWVVVVGDVNATIACSIASKKLNIKVCHLEAGLRSFDMTMPEEINRVVTDRISDLLLTPDLISSKNLINEGINKNKIKLVGNIMIDTLMENKTKSDKLLIRELILKNSFRKNKNFNKTYALITLHRPFNVDSKITLNNLVDYFINHLSKSYNLYWPLHPRTKKMLDEFKLFEKLNNHPKVCLLHPLNYHEMLKLNMHSSLVITDSGGLQEECTVLKKPCITLRPNTERPVTLTEKGGVSILAGNDIEKIKKALKKIFSLSKKSSIPKYWDGRTANRCLSAILNFKLY